MIFRENRSDQGVLKGEAVLFKERRRAGCCFQRGSVRVLEQRWAAPEKLGKTLLHQRIAPCIEGAAPCTEIWPLQGYPHDC